MSNGHLVRFETVTIGGLLLLGADFLVSRATRSDSRLWSVLFLVEICVFWQSLLSCDVLDMSNSGKLYQKVPLWLSRGIQKLSLAGTTISSKNFLRLTTEAQKLRTLDIENCRNISEEVIFNAKYKLQSLRSVNISCNSQFGVLTIACLLSYDSVIDICCRGKKLSDKELLFLSKTFPSLPGIGLRLDGISRLFLGFLR